ncbi:hypothetical protein [Motiliproteus sp. MSK22-1]|uniref:hypothetical protein n=1 Tax=Motiliproteus sp. MSK22-1 TaxID=1897630 RepID=UPI0009769987|nr:hypothetical protein [Motiliproteus sp. MSK22-1]OMH33894.1 hypothetical protein BGP75_13010 [Motiliproteus sp. MSK22-1]
MLDGITKTHKALVRNYIHAKDENRPHLMKNVFSDSAILKMELKTENISFPSEVVGLDAITDVLVRNFSGSYENVYTYCLTDSLEDYDQELFCKWLVVMNDKENGDVRIGCGRYHWHFVGDSSSRVSQLIISIEHMAVLPAETQSLMFAGLSRLPYPWCDLNSVLEFIPLSISLKPLREFFR